MGILDVLSKATVYAACIIIPLCIIVGTSRLLLHPLRNYPGPLSGRLTEAYGGIMAVRKRLHLETHQNFEKYGPVIRQAPNRLLFNSATALHDIYLNPRATKGEAYRKTQMRSKYPNMINAIDKDQHRRKRRVIGRVFSDRSMRSFEPTLVGQINTFLQILFESSQSGASLEMSERCQRLAVDIVGHLAFGYPFDTQTKEVHRFLPKLLLGMTWRMNIYMQFPPIGSLEKLLAFIGVRKVLKVGNLVQTMIKSRLTKDADAYNDLFSYVANDIGKGQQGLYEGEVWPESMLFIIAGGTTTSTAMSSLFFYLSRNPSSYITLAAEIRSTFKSAEEIRSGPVLNSCKYLRACIDEALRMSPPTLTPMWRQQDARDGSDEPFVVDGHVIPPNTQVAVSLYSLNHNEEYFPDSFTFKPERWLDTSQCGGGDASEGGDSRANMRKAFAPFLMGDRSCAGKSMAYMEISLTLARTLWFFDFEPAPGKAGEAGGGTLGRKDGRGRPNEFQLEDAFAAIHHGPNLVFRERDKLWRERLREE